ncbi:MAG: hypothetical protein JXR83_14045 [Deltaproteobacteria bacterium]|nr:hypothetical protein [Deltaproteobacteria bacterium]
MRWRDYLQRIDAELAIPYPERARFLDELHADLEAAFQQQRRQGLDDEAAERATLDAFELDFEAIAALNAVHVPAVQRLLARLPGRTRPVLESIAIGLPLLLLIALISARVPLASFLREGGIVSLVILAVGSLAVLLQFERLLLWFVLRDHTAHALRLNTSTPLYLAAASALLGILGSSLGCYLVLFAWSEGRIDAGLVRVGLRESLSPIVVGSAFATLVVLLHAALQAGLRALRVPDEKKGGAP